MRLRSVWEVALVNVYCHTCRLERPEGSLSGHRFNDWGDDARRWGTARAKRNLQTDNVDREPLA